MEKNQPQNPSPSAGQDAANSAKEQAPPIHDETKTLGVLSIIFAFFASVVGLILAIVGRSKAKQIKRVTGQEAEGATLINIGLACSIVMIVISVVVATIVTIVFVGLFEKCAELGSGTWEVDGITYVCGSVY